MIFMTMNTLILSMNFNITGMFLISRLEVTHAHVMSHCNGIHSLQGAACSKVTADKTNAALGPTECKQTTQLSILHVV